MTSIGAIDIIIGGAQSSGFGIIAMTLVITAVIVAVAGISNISTIEVVKRTAIPMTLALITTLVGTFLFIH